MIKSNKKLLIAVINDKPSEFFSNAIGYLSRCFTLTGVNFTFVTELTYQLNEVHPSWYKLLLHKHFSYHYDYILCWDYDLLPADWTVVRKLIEEIEIDQFYACIDSAIIDKIGVQGFTEIANICQNFRWNCGLLGIPRKHAKEMEKIYEDKCYSNKPSFEQYHLNDYFFENQSQITTGSSIYNVLVNDIINCDDDDDLMIKCSNIHYSYSDQSIRALMINSHISRASVALPRSFSNRIELVSSYLQPKMNGCELGVFKGEFSRILANLYPSRLYLVDLFRGIVGSGDSNGENMEYCDLEKSYNCLQTEYQNRPEIHIVRSNSTSFLNTLPDQSLDYIYIDADHSFESVYTDLVNSLSKIKKGGYIFGHEYIYPRFSGVVAAVNKFCCDFNLRIEALSQCGCPTYCIQI